MTDQQLQLALAKMLPEKIMILPLHPVVGQQFIWLIPSLQGKSLEETEWLHVCWLIEQDTILNEKLIRSIWFIEMQAHTAMCGIHASWQQRAIALCKVKGITS